MAENNTQFIIQLAIIIIVAKICGYISVRIFRLPAVLGELAAGIIISPYALGGLPLFFGHSLFPLPAGTSVLSPQLYGITSLAVIVLLFITGLETDAVQFLKFSGVATLVAVGGFFLSFFLGALSAVYFIQGVNSITHPSAMFFGAMGVTSVSITARILTERRKMNSSEASTILAAAMLDDVLGIILLSVVIGAATAQQITFDWYALAIIAGKAFGFWVICLSVGFLLAPRLIRGLKQLRSFEVLAGITFGIALLLAGIAESVGLATIVGAYLTGLALSQTDIVNELREQIRGLNLFLVPVFFVSMGMLLDLTQLHRSMLMFTIVFTVVSLLSKVIGCSIPSLFFGFNLRGALRIGVGMIPRGEVTLIIAGAGLTSSFLTKEMFGSALLLVLASSIITPLFLNHLFNDKPGQRKPISPAEKLTTVELVLQSPRLIRFLVSRIVDTFRAEEFFVNRLNRHASLYQIRKDNTHITLEWNKKSIRLITNQHSRQLVRLILLEDILDLKETIGEIEKMQTQQYESLLGNILKD